MPKHNKLKPGDLVTLTSDHDFRLVGFIKSRDDVGTHGTMHWDANVPGVLLKLHKSSHDISARLWDVLLPCGIGRCSEYRLTKLN